MFRKKIIKSAIHLFKKSDLSTMTPYSMQTITHHKQFSASYLKIRKITPPIHSMHSARLFSTTSIPQTNAGPLLKIPKVQEFFSFKYREAKISYKHIGPLLQFIKKNEFIPTFLAEIKSDDLHLREKHTAKSERLLTAIQRGDFKADIFSDRHGYLYLLHLIEEGKIDFWSGVTVHVYLMALMQFSTQLSLREEDGHLKYPCGVTVDVMVANQQLTIPGEHYLEKVCERIKELNYDLDYPKVVKFVLGLPPVEQWLLKIHYEPNGFTQYDNLTRILIHNISFIIETDSGNETKRDYWVPSSSVIHYILQQLSPKPIEMLPIFGKINPITLLQVHQQGAHPVALYATDVRSNLPSADGRCGGPFALWLHDVGHVFWASLLTPLERRIVFTDIIAPLNEVLKAVRKQNDTEVEKVINSLIEMLNDFDLTSIHVFRDSADRLYNYLLRVFRRAITDKHEHMENKMGLNKLDRLFFLLSKMYAHFSFFNPGYKIWNKLLRSYPFGAIDAIRRAALLKLSNNSPFDEEVLNPIYWKDINIHWAEWRKLLEECKDSETLWKRALDERHHELLKLVVFHDLKFFHPYIPMTEEEREKLDKLSKSNGLRNGLR